MSSVLVKGGRLSGTIAAPPSKSQTHRAIICAALAKGESTVSPIELSEDIIATLNAVQALGAAVEIRSNSVTIDGTGTFRNTDAAIDCGESGSTLRFILPLAAAGGVTTHFTGRGKLPSRPIDTLLHELESHGVTADNTSLPLQISGKLTGGKYKIPGDITSQFISGLLLCLPLLQNDSEIVLTSPLQSVQYVDMTIDCMKSFGVEASRTKTGYKIKGGQSYTPRKFTVEGDWSQAAFFLSAGAISGDCTVTNLNPHSKQGDRAIAELLARFGANITWQEDGSIRAQSAPLCGIDIDATDIPDLVPILSVVSAFAKGTTEIHGAGRLRIKESDRLAAVRNNLSRLDIKIEGKPDGLTINGTNSIISAPLEGYNDHRIVMSMAIAALKAPEPVLISDYYSINKSYPTFFEDFGKLGGEYYVINMGK